MTETLLKQLYNGEIYPSEIINCKDPQYRELSHKISDETEYFKKTLSPEDWKRLEQLDDMIDDRSAACSYENFSYGFRLGMGLMIEVFTDRNENK